MLFDEELKTKLYHVAEEATNNAYAPYSKFRVGAALLTDKGDIYTGCNVENVSYGMTICGERNAIVHAVSVEGPKMKIRAMAVATMPKIPASPCGACRQVMLEFTTPESVLYFMGDKGIEAVRIRDLLPSGFQSFVGEDVFGTQEF